MCPITTLLLSDGTQITVPDSLNLITTYVLREQGDWFEDEIKFLRFLLKSGQKVIDIGANYGVYTLSMAKLVGPTGRVWAFEPASKTARLLAESIATNNFNHVVLEQAALSNMNGIAQLSLHDNSELNSLVHEDKPLGVTEIVPMTTLDEYIELHNLQNIEFIKLDAEGEESNILRGGAHFFSTQSPLIQYEVKGRKKLHLELVHAFAELGYTSYRLVPGLNVLVPFNKEERIDGYLLNLFCCKPDCAAQLAAQGLLVEATMESLKEKVWSNRSCRELGNAFEDSWLTTLTKYPYGEICADYWKQMVVSGECGEVESALSCYLLSQSSSLTTAERFFALRESFTRLKALCDTQPAYMRLASLARVAREYGARSIAVKALGELRDTIFRQQQINVAEPFLAPGERFDTVSPCNSIAKWIGAAVLEEFERNCSFSSFYTGVSARQRLTVIRNLGLGSDEMNRRLELVELRFGVTDHSKMSLLD